MPALHRVLQHANILHISTDSPKMQHAKRKQRMASPELPPLPTWSKPERSDDGCWYFTMTMPTFTGRFRTDEKGYGCWELRSVRWEQILGTSQFFFGDSLKGGHEHLNQLGSDLRIREFARINRLDPVMTAIEVGARYVGR